MSPSAAQEPASIIVASRELSGWLELGDRKVRYALELTPILPLPFTAQPRDYPDSWQQQDIGNESYPKSSIYGASETLNWSRFNAISTCM